MRILVVSDLHYRLPHYDWLLEAADTVDAVVIAGDLADVVSPVPHEVQTVVISRYLAQLAERTTVLAASGNHDLDGPAYHGEQVARWLRRLTHDGLHVDGSSIDIGDTRFTVCPWWDGPITRDEVGDPAGRGRPGPPGAVGVDLPRTARRHAPVPRRSPYLPRRRARRVDRPAPPRPRLLRPHPPGPVGRRRDVARPAGRDLGVQRGQADRQGAASHHPRHRGRDGGLVRGVLLGEACRSTLSERGRPRGRGPSRSARAVLGGGPGGRGSRRPCPDARRRRRTGASRPPGTA